MPPDRPKKLTVMLSKDEERKLKAEAERRGLTISDVIRQGIRESGPLDDVTRRRAQATPTKVRA